MNTLEVYDIAIGIELRLSNIYYRFSTLFKDNSEVHNFWAGIANHKKCHSEALILSKGYIICNRNNFSSGHNASLSQGSDIKYLESLELMLREYERMVKKKRVSLQEALDILLKIENSELNHLYNSLINLSGFKHPQKPENTYSSIYEHVKLIKLFIDKYYRGNLPSIRVEDYLVKPPFPTTSTGGAIKGKVIEIVSDMSYGFIEGVDGNRYMFLPEDISYGEWKDARVNKDVEFSFIGLPWGPRAKDICFKS